MKLNTRKKCIEWENQDAINYFYGKDSQQLEQTFNKCKLDFSLLEILAFELDFCFTYSNSNKIHFT